MRPIKSPAVFIFIRVLDDFYRENRGSVNRLGKLLQQEFRTSFDKTLSFFFLDSLPAHELEGVF